MGRSLEGERGWGWEAGWWMLLNREEADEAECSCNLYKMVEITMVQN